MDVIVKYVVPKLISYVIFKSTDKRFSIEKFVQLLRHINFVTIV